MEYRHPVWKGHWLFTSVNMIFLNNSSGHKIKRGTDNLEIRLQALHDEPHAAGRHEIKPLFAPGWIHMHGKVVDPVDPRRLGIAGVDDIVDMSLATAQRQQIPRLLGY